MSERSIWVCDRCGQRRTSDGGPGMVPHWRCENIKCPRYGKPVTVWSDSERKTPEGRRAR